MSHYSEVHQVEWQLKHQVSRCVVVIMVILFLPSNLNDQINKPSDKKGLDGKQDDVVVEAPHDFVLKLPHRRDEIGN